MKYEILDKDAQGVIVSSDGKLYRVEYPCNEIRTIGMATSKVYTHVDWEIGEHIDHMAGTPVNEYIESCNEVEQSMTSQGKIIYTYKWVRSLHKETGFFPAISGWIDPNHFNTTIVNIDSLSRLKL